MAPLVLLTGASGFIGAHIVDRLIEKGYRVRGTVRSESKILFFEKKLPAEFQSGQLSFAIVPDIAQPDAFKDALKGMGPSGRECVE